MSLQLLENCLAHVEHQIVSQSISEVINSLVESRCLQSYSILKNKYDISSIIYQAEASYSPLRLSSILCLEIASSVDSTVVETYYLKLLNSLLNASLYDSVLEIVDQCHTVNYTYLSLALFACHRTNRWNMLLQYFDVIPKNQVTVNNKLLAIRAFIERDRPSKAHQLLQEISPIMQEYNIQYHILSILIKHRLGQITIDDIKNILLLSTCSSPSETAALSTILPTIESLICREELLSESFAIIINNFWQSLSSNTLLVDGFYSLPSLSQRSQIKRLAFVTDNINYIPILQSIADLMLRSYHDLNSIDIFFIGDEMIIDDYPTKVIDLSGKSITAALRCLRALNIDVVFDTIGCSSNSRWLEILAQKIASYQIGWFAADYFSYFAPFYNYIIVDRWTKPLSLNYFSTKILEFSGITTLSTYSCISDNSASHLICSSIDMFIILGKPDQLFPGSQQLIKSLILRYPQVTIHMIDSIWQESGLLDFWWSSVYAGEVVPNQIVSSVEINQNSISKQVTSSLILSFYDGPPPHYLSFLLSAAIPIVCLSSGSFQSKSMIALLDSLGLGSFTTDNLEYFYEIIDTIKSDDNLRMEIINKLPNQLKNSLTLNYELFASDLYQSLSFLSG